MCWWRRPILLSLHPLQWLLLLRSQVYYINCLKACIYSPFCSRHHSDRYWFLLLVWAIYLLCFLVLVYSQKTYKTMGCLDTSRGGKLFQCVTTSWQGYFPLIFVNKVFFVVFFNYWWLTCHLLLQNFEKITCRVQSKNKDQVHTFTSEMVFFLPHFFSHAFI